MAISRTKVAIIGAGKVGATLAYHLAVGHICDDLVLVDIDPQKAWAEATDLQHSLGFSGRKMRISACFPWARSLHPIRRGWTGWITPPPCSAGLCRP